MVAENGICGMGENEKIELKRTEEVQEIVDRMPVKGARWVVTIVLGLVVLMFFSALSSAIRKSLPVRLR